MRDIIEPNKEQLEAVRAFAKRHGRTWKADLNTAWYSGSDAREPDGHLLRQARNNAGPEWLEKFRLEDATTPALRCEYFDDCAAPVTHVDSRGFIYCATHGALRKRYERCRKLTRQEFKRLQTGLRLERY